MNSLTHRPRLKKDLWSKFRLRLKIWTSRQAECGSRTQIHSWSTIHCVFKIWNQLDFAQKSAIQMLLMGIGQIRWSGNLFTPLLLAPIFWGYFLGVVTFRSLQYATHDISASVNCATSKKRYHYKSYFMKIIQFIWLITGSHYGTQSHDGKASRKPIIINYILWKSYRSSGWTRESIMALRVIKEKQSNPYQAVPLGQMGGGHLGYIKDRAVKLTTT